MKSRIFILLTFAFLTNLLNAQTNTGSYVSDWGVTSSNVIHKNTASQKVVMKISEPQQTFTLGIVGVKKWNNANNAFDPYFVEFTLRYERPNGIKTDIGKFSISNSDFAGNNNVVDKRFNVTMNTSIFNKETAVQDGKLYLYWRNLSTHESGVSLETWGLIWDIDVANFIPDGTFVNNQSNGEVSVMFEGKLRHIQSLQTLEGLFDLRIPQDLKNYWSSQLLQVPKGLPIQPDNQIIHVTSANKIYMREGNIVRHISHPRVLELYKFNTKWMTTVSTLPAQYIIGSPILYW